MADNIVKDYLGYPCKIAQAYEHFADADIEKLRDEIAQEPRRLARDMGRALVLVKDRLVHNGNALQAAMSALPSDSDDSGAEAVLEMAMEYDTKTQNLFYELAGLVLLALERAGLAKDVRKEASHG